MKITNGLIHEIKALVNKLILIFCSVFLTLSVQSQASDSWQILYNKQVIFKGNSEQTNSTALLKISALNKTDKLTVRYFMDSPDDDWKRSFFVADEAEKNFLTINLNKQIGSVSFFASQLKFFKDKKEPFFIYTTSLPKNPRLAATIRVRRVLLCKIEWNKM